MIKSLPLVVSLFCAACGASMPANSLAGHWRGSVPWSTPAVLTIDAEIMALAGDPGYFEGTLSTDDPRCFTHGMLIASVTEGSLSLQADGAGTATQTTYITITGEADGADKIVGLFSMISNLAECSADATSFVFERQ